MKAIEAIELKEFNLTRLLTEVAAWRAKGKTVAFTNAVLTYYMKVILHH